MKKHIFPFVVVLAALWLLPCAAFAQGMDAPSPFGDEGDMGTDSGDLGSEPGIDDGVNAGDKVPPSVELPIKRKAKVVQKKLYSRAGRHEINAYFGINPADSFVFSLVEGLRYKYNITEYLGIQAVGGYMQSFNREATDFLTNTSKTEGVVGVSEEFVKNSELQWFAGADFVFTPLYGKFALMSSVIAHYDMGIYAGCAVMGLENGEYAPAPDIGINASIYLLNWLALRADFMYYALITEDKRHKLGAEGANIGSPSIVGEQRGGTLVRHNYFITLGVSFLLPAE